MDLQVAGVTSTFVPYETIETGGCRGPFIDLAITITNRGGTFPRPVDLEKREREYPGTNMPYFTVNLEFDWNNGVVGGQQAITVDKSMLSGGTLPKGGAITLPLRVPVGNNQTAVTVKPMIHGRLVPPDRGRQPARDRARAVQLRCPDLGCLHPVGQVASGPDREDKRILKGVIKATIVNLGKSPFPGQIEGNFNVRQSARRPGLLIASGRSLEGSSDILAGNEIRAADQGQDLRRVEHLPALPRRQLRHRSRTATSRTTPACFRATAERGRADAPCEESSTGFSVVIRASLRGPRSDAGEAPSPKPVVGKI